MRQTKRLLCKHALGFGPSFGKCQHADFTDSLAPAASRQDDEGLRASGRNADTKGTDLVLDSGLSALRSVDSPKADIRQQDLRELLGQAPLRHRNIWCSRDFQCAARNNAHCKSPKISGVFINYEEL